MARDETWAVYLYEGGKFVGYLTPSGARNRLKVHAACLSADQAEIAAAEINRDSDAYIARAKPLFKEGKDA